jgi:methylmalonyl-CoA mutase C-terminal domain/subunit
LNAKKRIKVIIAKPGLDGHDRGAKVVTMGLRDEGMEVIYTGLRQTPEMIAKAAVEEQPDVVGLSCLSGAHNYLFSEVVEQLRAKGMGNVIVIGGGNVPKEDVPFLKEHGVNEVFAGGSSIKDIANYIRSKVNA